MNLFIYASLFRVRSFRGFFMIQSSVAVIKVVNVVRYCACRVTMGLLCSPLSPEPLSLHSTLICLTVNDSIKDLTNYRQAPLHHPLLWWNELWICLFKVKRLHGQWWDTTASLSLETNGYQNTSFSCHFFVLLRFLTHKAAINHCHWCIFSLTLSGLVQRYDTQAFNDFWRLSFKEKHQD